MREDSSAALSVVVPAAGVDSMPGAEPDTVTISFSRGTAMTTSSAPASTCSMSVGFM